ncbi:hypothetical protein [Agrobacterium radiobacter]|uniref:hypothetical protein n=1 Tax=Agrobacterium radiobacter TaxID=362 RepID=UPI00160690A3|nr:hypothetical protein [Agrobacterium radiobacter]MBB4407100.1 hypothetical protein [Agrobacterium radiobacter]MBB4452696.1 hypothetical protein [Agrobacterium radiobacter]
MATLNINGRKVKVDDSFLSLSPEEQNAAVDEIAATLGKMAPEQPSPSAPKAARNEPERPKDGRDSFLGKADTFMRGAADTLSLGLADEIAAQAKSGPLTVQKPSDDYYNRGIFAGSLNPLGALARTLNAPFASETKNADYDRALAEQRAIDKSDSDNRGGYRIAGQIAGGVGQGVGLAKQGLSLAGNAVNRGAGLARVSGASLADGAILGTAQGFGSGEGVEGRIKGALTSGAIGAGIGAVAPGAVAGVSKVAKGAVAPLFAPFMPEPYAREAIAQSLRRSGKTPEQIARIMRVAADEGQPMYNVADAMGYTGERLMSTVARNPSEARQSIVETLRNRQGGQGERLAQFVAEGLEAPDTAAQRAATLTADQEKTANALYNAARKDAGPVNVTPVIEAIDETLSPGVNSLLSPRDKIANDSIEGALQRVRNLLTDGRSNVTDFNVLFRTKLDLDDMIKNAEGKGAGNRAHYLSRVQKLIDDALADASPTYTRARDTFARDARRIEAVDTGSAAFRPSSRAADNISRFARMTPEEQAGFRVGYADPAIARLESASLSPTTNKARILQTPKTKEELQAFAVPDNAQVLGRRVGREQRMFDTAAAALGGSKTADNLADAADVAKFDPSVMSNLFHGNYVGALTTALAKALTTAKGTPPKVIENIAKTLLETNPEAALRILSQSSQKLAASDQLLGRISQGVVSSGAAGAGRL